MTRALAAMAFLAAFLGCAHVPLPPPRDGEGQAVDIIWHEVFGRTDRPPLIRWRRGKELDCFDKDSGKLGFLIPDIDENGIPMAMCREGFTWSTEEVLAADHGEPFSQSVIEHELWHVARLRDGDWRPATCVRRNGGKEPPLEQGFWDPADCVAAGLPVDRGRCAIVARAIGAVMEAGR